MNSKKLIAAYIVVLMIAACSATAMAAPPTHLPPTLLAVAFGIDDPCALPPPHNSGKYWPVSSTLTTMIKIPQAARDAHVIGYAGAEFQLDAGGTPVNVKLLCESPTGYGFGEALLEAFKHDRYKPGPGQPAWSPDHWYYTGVGMEPTSERAKRKH